MVTSEHSRTVTRSRGDTMDLSTALQWAAERKNGVLITLRQDGRPQSSDVVYAVGDAALVISVTATRAKTHNMRRDPRVVLHLTDPATWSYLSFDGTVSLSPVTTSPTDATSDELVRYYELVAGAPHPNWDEYRQAMINDQRLLATFTPTAVTGQIR
jgi:PPOX class probable F420-dependent enzyme